MVEQPLSKHLPPPPFINTSDGFFGEANSATSHSSIEVSTWFSPSTTVTDVQAPSLDDRGGFIFLEGSHAKGVVIM